MCALLRVYWKVVEGLRSGAYEESEASEKCYWGESYPVFLFFLLFGWYDMSSYSYCRLLSWFVALLGGGGIAMGKPTTDWYVQNAEPKQPFAPLTWIILDTLREKWLNNRYE